MNIYKANFETKEQGQDYLFSIGVLVENESEIVFSKDTAAVVYIGKVVKIPATYDKEGNTNLHRQFTTMVMLSM